nr:hypothetical protein OH837_42595 [Streptomyces canus]
MTTIKRKFAVGLAMLAAGCGLASLAAPADAAVGAPGAPVIHRCNPDHITPGSHVFLLDENGPNGDCLTGKGTLRFNHRSVASATNLKPVNGKLMKIRLFYVNPMGEHKVAVLDHKNQTIRFDYSELTKVVITAL